MTAWMRAGRLVGILLLALWASSFGGAFAQTEKSQPSQQQGDEAPAAQQAVPADPSVTAPIKEWDRELNRLTTELGDAVHQDQVERIREELGELRPRIERYVETQSPRLPELEARLQSLGEAPPAGEPPEPAPVAEQRAELQKAVGDVQGGLKAAEEALLRVEALTSRARDIRRALFETQVLERGTSPLSPRLWDYIGRDLPIGFSRLDLLLSNWWDGLWSPTLFVLLFFVALGIWGGLSWLARQRVQSAREWTGDEPPSEWQRAASAGRVILFRSLPMVIAGAFFYLSTSEAQLLSSGIERLVISGVASLILITTVQAVTKSALAVNRPHWRLMQLPDNAARTLYYHLMVLAVVYGVDFFISALFRVAYMPFSVSIGQSFLSAVMVVGIIMSMLRIRADGSESGTGFIGRSYVRLPLWAAALFILGAALIGYVALARFIAGQLIVTSTILIIVYLLIITASAFGQSMTEERSRLALWLQDQFSLDHKGRQRLALPVMLLIKGAIIVIAVPLVLLQWGFDWYDISSWLRQAFFGFELGGVKISVTAIIVALFLFIIGYIAAKFFQEWLDGYVLERAGVEQGMRDSVRTGVGYLGVALAAVLAISYLGLDFSNLAIVAGALSVGVGFGLQSIVNNFVSGLILLAERPIKSGDWIIAGGHEGIVRKISVRSTEIETFDRANVVIPNSVLIQESVKNWTLHNATGRMPIPVGVHYTSDPEKVRDLLLDVANAHPHVLSNPAPFVYFDGFGDSALNFTLYVYLDNVNRSFSARTDLRIGVLKAFRDNDVEIPYPQTDVHLRDLDWIKQTLNERRAQPEEPRAPRSGRRDYKSESEEADEGEGDGQGH